MTAVQLFGAALAALLIVAGILLVIAGFIITRLDAARRAKERGAQPQADIFDVLVELAKRVELIYVPGFLLIAFGVAIFLAVLAGVGAAA